MILHVGLFDNEIRLISLSKYVIAASGLPNPNSQWEGEVEFIYGLRQADGVYSPCVLIRGP